MKEEAGEIKHIRRTTDSDAFFVLMICSLGLAVALLVAPTFYAINLVSDISFALRLIWVIECPIVILLFSHYRQDERQCSYSRAIGRGLLGLPVGAIVNAFGAIVLGAPVGTQYLAKTINWGLMMSLFTTVPAACVFGTSWPDWQRLFAHTKPSGFIEYMICLPAHGAVLGAWIGAWPMPLDWERPWQEWPICVSYGALAGYSAGIAASLAYQILVGRRVHCVKRD